MGGRTSLAVTLNASQSILGRTFRTKSGWKSSSCCSSSALRTCSGNEAEVDLQLLTAQLTKFIVRTFMLGWFGGGWVFVLYICMG